MSKHQRGFTLVEIIVVLVILAILAVVAIPTMIGYVDRAKEAEILQDVRTIRTAFDTSLVWAAGENNLGGMADHGQIFINLGTNYPFDVALQNHMNELLKDDLSAKSYTLSATMKNDNIYSSDFLIYIVLTYDRNGKEIKYNWNSNTGELKKQ